MFAQTRTITSFSVDQLDEAERFYGGTLGLDVVRQSEDGASALLLRLADGHTVFVYPKPDHVPASYTVLNFAVEDIDRAVDDLSARDVPFLRFAELGADERGIVRMPARDIAWFTDPAGNVHSVAHLRTPLATDVGA